jgi:very-short-patch-repair endonuclease
MAYGFSLDCFIEVEGIKIDVEYDGWYWHKNRREQDKRKNDFLIDRGYRVLRIRANRKAPTKEQIIKAVDYLVKDNHHLAYIDLDIDI